MNSFDDLDRLGSQRKPFLFISDFKAQRLEVFEPKDLINEDIEFSINQNYTYQEHSHYLKLQPVTLKSYSEKFAAVIEKIKSGETYILNLTQPTKITTKLSLKEIYKLSNAAYKLRFKDEFVCFSPEKFIQIQENKIHTYPMKGTIDSSVKNAKEKILADKKEMAEHIMVVDLLRNDLSIVADKVKVEAFRYVTEIDAGDKKLLQVSSHISGNVGDDWHSKIGSILKSLLPAGSISGAPKKSTLEIIENIEAYERGFFSGVFGYYDGEKLESGVMIRFIEKKDGEFLYKSGGGITLDSGSTSEYNELLDKIYLP
ncbi:MAG: aminodeoxychorismate synthase component I [Sulfurimonas sp.]